MSTALAHEIESIHARIEECQARIAAYQEEIKRFRNELHDIDAELEEISDERQKYELLSDVCHKLEKLSEIGGNSLFWLENFSDEQASDHLERVRGQLPFFERRLRKITDKREDVFRELEEKNLQVEYLLEDIEILKEREEESKHDYVIERDVVTMPRPVVVMPWTKRGEDEKRFRKIILIALLLSILLGWLIPLWEVPIPDRSEPVKIPERLTKLIKKKPPPPKPKKVEPKKPEEQKKQDKKKPTKKERDQARKKVQNKGVLAFRNNLADLLDEMPEDKLGANAALSNKGAVAKNIKRNIITTQAASSSGGISRSAVSRNVAGSSSDKLAAVGFSRVESGIGEAVAEDRPLSDGPGPSRTDEEIQIVFDKYKAALYRIYNRELRKNPTLQGKMVLRITIEPNGSVSFAKVESTDLDSKTLLSKIVARVKKFNFGEKPGVPKVTILYPIDFLPAS